MSIMFIIFLLVAGAAVVWVIAAVLVAYFRLRQVAQAPSLPAPPFKCPACASEQIDVLLSSLWDGVDSAGRGTGGLREVGTCKICGVHSQYASFFDHDQRKTCYEIRKLSDEEWRQEIEPHEKRKQEAENWPFQSKNENRVA